MKNVVIVAIDRERYAIELRWVEEIIVLPHVTPVPTAPAVIVGAINHKGAIVSVLSTRALVARRGATTRTPRTGDAALLVTMSDHRVAIAVDRIDEVTTLVTREGEPDQLRDAQDQVVPLLEPTTLLDAARRMFPGSGRTT